MSLAKLVTACGLIGVALFVSACGIQAKPVAGTTHLNRSPGNHSYVSDPRTPYLKCLRKDGFKVRKFVYGSEQLRALQINKKPYGPTIVFEPTAGIAEGDQMKGTEQAAEIIGQALVYPWRTKDKTMLKIENCVSIDVKG